jgi:PTS system nitrogen regulatory IIA component
MELGSVPAFSHGYGLTNYPVFWRFCWVGRVLRTSWSSDFLSHTCKGLGLSYCGNISRQNSCVWLQISHTVRFLFSLEGFMDHEIMTIEEVAAYLRVSERTVYDWAQKGQLPGGKLGTTWRFKRLEIENWVNSQLGAKPASSSVVLGDDVLSKLLVPERVVFLEGSEKENALKTLCAVLATSSVIPNEEELASAIFRREELMSTGIGFGVGVPHVRLDGVRDLVMALGIAREPLSDYVSLDDVPVQIVCMVAASKAQHPQYIRTLSAISTRLKDESVRQNLIKSSDVLSVYKLFTGRD